MRKFVLKSLLFLVPSLFMTSQVMAQYLIKGKLVDADNQETLIGATAIIDGTTIGAAADYDGNFEINAPQKGSYTLIFRNVGYQELQKKVQVNAEITNLGTLSLKSTAVGLNDVTVIASVVRADRQTPVAVSNIKVDVLEEKLGAQEFPEILKQTPSVYATKSSGGYGDSRINMRGFDSNNIGVLVNGVPINDMENGKVYWSNWAGLSDVTQFMQVQRGLGASKLALSSAGGTINIITKSTEAKKGGTFSTTIGNDAMVKTSLALSTGLMKNGWSFTGLLARNTGNGYIQGTDYEGYSYFFNVSKMINESHRLSLTGFGAPQWHNQRGVMHTEEQWAEQPDGIRSNSTYGFYKGKVTGGPYGYNEFHKPQFSLNHYWTINDKSTLSTAAYASIATGGGRRSRYATDRAKNWLSWNSYTGQPYAATAKNEATKLTSEGYLDIDAVVAENKQGENSEYVFTSSINSHKWFGILSSYNNQLTDQLSVTAGYDGRYYTGEHYEEIADLLGGNGFVEKTPLYGREKGTVIGIGDKTGFYNKGDVIWQGIFGQTEFSNDQYSAFLSASLTYQGYIYHVYDKAPVDGTQTSDLQSFLPWSIKGGFNWKINEKNNVFINGGYFTRAPYMNNVFKNYTIKTYDVIDYEKISTIEAGYTFALKNFSATVNGYFTEWKDRGKNVSANYKDEAGNSISSRGVYRGLDARHMGVELETSYKPVKNVELRGMFSLGDWTYINNANVSIYDEDQVLRDEYTAYIKGVHVGNSAQMTAAVTASWEIIKGLKVSADWNYFGKNYGDFEANDRKKEDYYEAYKIPNYYTFDANASYRMPLKNGMGLSFFLNGNNLLNKKYIADAKDATVNGERTGLVYYGYGTTWSAGLKLNF